MRQALQSLVLLIAIFPNASISEITSIKNYETVIPQIGWIETTDSRSREISVSGLYCRSGM